MSFDAERRDRLDKQARQRALPCPCGAGKPSWGAAFLFCEICSRESLLNIPSGHAVRTWNKDVRLEKKQVRKKMVQKLKVRKSAKKEGTLQKLKVGQSVWWWSSAAGSTKRKEGTVVKVLAAGDRLSLIDQEKFALWGAGYSRSHRSYVVRVVRISVRTSKVCKPQFYWPRTSALCWKTLPRE